MPEQENNNRKRQRRQMPLDPTYGHLPPQALEVEDAVLGALMIDKDAYAIVCELLHPESFYDPRHQMIYTAIRDLNMDERPVDVLTVTEQLAKSGNLDRQSGGSRRPWLCGRTEFKGGFFSQYRVPRPDHSPEVPGPTTHFLCECHSDESL